MKKLQLLAYFMALLLVWGCSESLCGDRFSYYDGAEKTLDLGISLRYELTPGNWQSMIGIYGPYRWDTVKIYDENMEIYDRYDYNNHDFGLTYGDKDTPRGVDIVKTFYLYLNYQDTDTMRFEYKINPSKCDKILNYGRFYYNNQLIESSKNEDYILFASVIK